MFTTYYGITSVIFGLLLFFPMRKFIFALSLNKLQRKENRAATIDEREKIRGRSTILAVIISLTFAFIYNKVIMVKFFGGVN